MSKDVVFTADESKPEELLKEFFEKFSYFSEEDKKRISDAWDFLLIKSQGVSHSSGSAYYVHAMRVAFILAQSEFDADCIISAFFHTYYNLQIPEEEIENRFGETVKKIVVGIGKIRTISVNSKTLVQADAIRKMLFAMSDDIRIIFIKIADRLDHIRNIRNLENEKQRALAAEIIDIWAPLADRLGMQQIKNEFEDLSLKYTNPDAFQQIKAVISQKKDERANYLNNAVSKIQEEAQKVNINVTITSRAKHFYSIYQKMRKRNKEPGELYDLLALRIICQKAQDCYTLIGIVHSLWKPLEGRFKDYIAMPKANGYQSLHTTVMCGDRPLEIQIRTQKMHDIAEHGVASHWLYKKGTNHDLVNASQLGIFNQLQELKDKQMEDESSFKQFKDELLADEIVVFTPKGDVKKLPIGSTAIDFAYAIHSAVGEKIVGAKADGKIIPLTQELKNTQIIEILTNPQAHPTENQLKYCKTGRARNRINSWLAANDPNFIDKAAQQRENDLNSEKNGTHQAAPQEKRGHHKGNGQNNALQQPKVEKVKIGNTSNFMITFAQCCHPTYPDPIVGYVSRYKGITVHKATCLTFQRIQNVEKRTVEIEWDEAKN